ncbi:uncharacterized protein LOC121728073 [Aricia agestis]|uniref:uncharacterized protein LOC121728073 n=1 Tax=Aricia agestis TaxID=91739 RepID=UPI001C209037|nr:uncharacterized protein LOC121728073 [Aricia agestis]
MKAFLLLPFVVAVVLAYKDVDDNFDFEAMVKDPVALKKNMNCFLDVEPCTPTMAKYRNHALEAVTDGCKECNKLETHTLRVLLQGLFDTYPDGYIAFKNKYDPTGTHFDALLKKLKNF